MKYLRLASKVRGCDRVTPATPTRRRRESNLSSSATPRLPRGERRNVLYHTRMSVHPMLVMMANHPPPRMKRGTSGCMSRAALGRASSMTLPRLRHDEGFVEGFIGHVRRCLARIKDAQDPTMAPQLVDPRKMRARFARSMSASHLLAGRSGVEGADMPAATARKHGHRARTRS